MIKNIKSTKNLEDKFGCIDKIYWDTSFLYHTVDFILGNRKKERCKKIYDFLDNKSENIESVISYFVISEAINALVFNNVKNDILNYGRKTNLHFLRDHKDNKGIKHFRTVYTSKYREIYDKHYRKIEIFRSLITSDFLKIYYLKEPGLEKTALDKVFTYMNKYKGELDAGDAFHLAIANNFGINNILTCDSDFTKIKDFNIYLVAV